MAIPVSLRGDFKASQLRAFARKTKDGPQARQLLTLAAIYDGATRTEAAKIGGVTLQIIRDWGMRFNALAADRSFAMGIRGVPHHGRQADVEPGASRDGLPQALGTTPPSCASRGSHRGF